MADRVLGSQFLQDIAEFFILFQTLSEGFVARAQEVQRLLADRRTTFIVVSTLETVPVREAEAFMGLLPARGFTLARWCSTGCCPRTCWSRCWQSGPASSVPSAADLAGALCSSGGALEGVDPALVERVLREVGTNFSNIGVVAKREASPAVGAVPAVRAWWPACPSWTRTSTTWRGVLEAGPPHLVRGTSPE